MAFSNPTRKFGREKNQRNALMKSLVTALIKQGKIKTTLAKAKEMRPMVEKIITKGKTDTLASRRLLLSRLGLETAVSKVLKDLSPKYKERSGGYTRIVKLPQRISDGSPMAYIEFV